MPLFARTACFLPLGLVIAGLALGSCSEGSGTGDTASDAEPRAGREAPADAVLLVEDVPIRAAEVDALVEAVRASYPSYVKNHHRRMVLTNYTLPRAALEAQHAAERAAALARAREVHEDLAAGSAPPREPVVSQSRGRELGIRAWSRLQELDLGTWSEPLEDLGRFHLVRILDKEVLGKGYGEAVYTLEILDYPYLEEESADRSLDAAVERSALTVTAPEWGDLVPEEWKYRMRGSKQ